ncbi:MAG: hypothetical protein ACREDR_18085 [Blastocatellia bacterium]
MNSSWDVVRACANETPDEELRLASETAALQWKFKPPFGGVPGGTGAYCQDTIPFHFVLDPAENGSSAAGK